MVTQPTYWGHKFNVKEDISVPSSSSYTSTVPFTTTKELESHPV